MAARFMKSTGMIIGHLSSCARGMGKQRLLLTLLRQKSTTPAATFKFSDLQVEQTNTPRPKPDPDSLVFGREFSDHMLEVDWSENEGWAKPRIRPLQNFSLHPAAKVFHYAVELYEGLKAYRGPDNRIRIFRPDINIIRMKSTALRATLPLFEGMKAYRDSKDKIRLFRPDCNVDRMRKTASRSALPDFDGEEFIKCLKKLISVDQEWVPYSDVSTLYIRPTMIGTEAGLGVSKASEAKLYVITGPVGPYYPTGFKPVSLLADPKYVRASEGGVGGYKMGSNYAPTIYTQIEAMQRHQCQQVLWLYGPEHRVTEVGTMNVFLFWNNEQGEPELVTPPLSSGLILPGVTRLSLLELARKWGEFKVSEREITMANIVKALKEKRVKELFGSGTACVVCPVEKIIYQGETLHIPTMDDGAPLTMRFNKELTDMQFGRVSSDWSVTID